MPRIRWQLCDMHCTSLSLLSRYLVTLPLCGIGVGGEMNPTRQKTSTGWSTTSTSYIPTTTKRHMTSFCYWVVWVCAAAPLNNICSSRGSSPAWIVIYLSLYARLLFALLMVPENKLARSMPLMMRGSGTLF
ncbi:hypothetical protein EV424DRAFT_1411244 [Suillus variegatus]|nr:hypothetical protein EV424DRAFT_1411244 [Suillus variegatus]